MANNSRIEWTEATWNPVLGCSKKSPGCKNCYAIYEVHRLAGNPNPKIRTANAGLTVIQNGAVNWTGVARLIPERLLIPVQRKKPTTYFVNSLSDLFHEALPDADVAEVFRAMARCPQHTFQVLTKSELRMAEIMPRITATFGALPNVLVGASVENQEWADRRREALRSVAGSGWRAFVSYEPALGPVNWKGWEFLSWLISGGESGKGARPSHPEWHRVACGFCVTYRIPYLFKQWGNWRDRRPGDPDKGRVVRLTRRGRNGQDLAYAADGGDVWLQRFPKKLAGRSLDGRTWDEMPLARQQEALCV